MYALSKCLKQMTLLALLKDTKIDWKLSGQEKKVPLNYIIFLIGPST